MSGKMTGFYMAIFPNVPSIYTNGWKSDLPNVPNDFDYQPDKAPMGIYNSAEEAFSAILSPGIINMLVLFTRFLKYGF